MAPQSRFHTHNPFTVLNNEGDDTSDTDEEVYQDLVITSQVRNPWAKRAPKHVQKHNPPRAASFDPQHDPEHPVDKEPEVQIAKAAANGNCSTCDHMHLFLLSEDENKLSEMTKMTWKQDYGARKLDQEKVVSRLNEDHKAQVAIVEDKHAIETRQLKIANKQKIDQLENAHKDEVRQLKSTIESQQQGIMRAKDECNHVVEQRESLKDLIPALHYSPTTCEDPTTELVNLKNTVTELRAAKSQNLEAIAVLSKQVTDLKDDAAVFRTTGKLVEKYVEDLEKQIKDGKQQADELEKLKVEQFQKERYITWLEAQLTKATASSEELREHLAAQKDDYQTLRKLQYEVESREEYIVELESQLVEGQAHCADLEMSKLGIRGKEQRIEALEYDIRKTHKYYDQKEQEWKDENEKLNNKVTDLENQVRDEIQRAEDKDLEVREMDGYLAGRDQRIADLLIRLSNEQSIEFRETTRMNEEKRRATEACQHEELTGMLHVLQEYEFANGVLLEQIQDRQDEEVTQRHQLRELERQNNQLKSQVRVMDTQEAALQTAIKENKQASKRQRHKFLAKIHKTQAEVQVMRNSRQFWLRKQQVAATESRHLKKRTYTAQAQNVKLSQQVDLLLTRLAKDQENQDLLQGAAHSISGMWKHLRRDSAVNAATKAEVVDGFKEMILAQAAHATQLTEIQTAAAVNAAKNEVLQNKLDVHAQATLGKLHQIEVSEASHASRTDATLTRFQDSFTTHTKHNEDVWEDVQQKFSAEAQLNNNALLEMKFAQASQHTEITETKDLIVELMKNTAESLSTIDAKGGDTQQALAEVQDTLATSQKKEPDAKQAKKSRGLREVLSHKKK